MKSIGDNLKLYRIRNGLSLTKAGEMVGLSAPGLLKYEKNLINPSLDKLSLLANIYNTTLDELLNVKSGVNIKFNNFQVDNRVSDVKADKIKSLIQKKVDNYFDLLDKSNIKLTNKFGVHIINSVKEAESLATKLRIFFQIPLDVPIYNLIYLLENNDIMVITLDNNNVTDGFIGFYETINNVPVIVVPKVDNGYEQRFKVAKFLGELLILANNEIEKDKYSTYFALSLLIPNKSLVKEFGLTRKKIDLNEIVIFSKVYKVSYKDIVKRLEMLQIITPSNAKYLNVDINKENLSEQVFLEEALNYDKMLYKCYALNIINDVKAYL